MLSGANRLKHEKDLKTLFASGKSVFDPVCGMKFRKNGRSINRFVVVVGTKVSKSAVDRNRIRRRIQALLRPDLPLMLPGYDVAFMVRGPALKKSSEEIGRSLKAVLRRSPLWPRSSSSK